MKCQVIVMLLAGMLLIPPPALAHKVTVFAWIEGDTVYTESKFSGGKRVKAGKIEVRDHDHRLVAEGTTDAKGAFSFAKPRGARLLDIILIAGMGHTNHWTVTAQELGITAATGDHGLPSPGPIPMEDGDPMVLDAEAVEQIVTRSLEKQLAPLKARLAQPAWGLRDIVAGLGYILGLMGLASYLNFRRKSRPASDTEPS